MNTRAKCLLKLSNGDEFQGDLIGASVQTSGEMVFTTGMVGYSEALTDPSYFGQILVFAYPLIGNYGIPPLPKELTYPLSRGFESSSVQVSGAIISIDSQEAFHWNSFQSIDSWLKKQNVSGIVGLDTRHLVQLIRETPGLKGKIVIEESTQYRELGHHQKFSLQHFDFFDPAEHLILPEVSVEEPTLIKPQETYATVAIVDCGIKWNIIRQLLGLGCEIKLLPWDHPLENVECQGWLLSNGPGDPNHTGDLKNRVATLLQQDKPILGICLGHQILALAAGFQTEKMSYGHRSHNQPVYQAGTRKGFITSQNHGYVVSAENIPENWDVWFLNANDQTVEGIRHRTKPIWSVQFHPEAAGGPRDTGWILEKFVTEVKANAVT